MEQAEYERMFHLENAHWWFVARRQMATALLGQWVTLGPKPRILDIGCGTGGNLAWLTQWGVGVGVDLSPLALRLAYCRHLPQLAQASSLFLPYPDQTFDLATLFDVLYHRWVSNDNQAIGEIYRVLRPGGWLLLTDSALPALWSHHDQIYYARQRYTLAEIQTKLMAAGFKPGLCSYTNMILLPAIAIERWLARWFQAIDKVDLYMPPAWLNRLFIWIRRIEIVWLRRGSSLPLGSSLVCLVQKPGGDYNFSEKDFGFRAG